MTVHPSLLCRLTVVVEDHEPLNLPPLPEGERRRDGDEGDDAGEEDRDDQAVLQAETAVLILRRRAVTEVRKGTSFSECL